MNRRRTEILLWVIAIAVSGLAGARAAAPLGGDVQAERRLTPTLDLTTIRENAPALDFGAELIRQNNPFRLDRTPAPLRYASPEYVEPAVPIQEPAQRPTLALHGITGPPWRALVAGLPGQDRHSVVRTGDSWGDLRVRSISRAEVVIVDADTTWILTVPTSWP